jgi:hypothetical protein
LYLEEPKIEYLPINLTNIVCSSEDCSLDGNFSGGGVISCTYNAEVNDYFGETCRTASNWFLWD